MNKQILMVTLTVLCTQFGTSIHPAAGAEAYPLSAYGLDTSAPLKSNIEALVDRQKESDRDTYDTVWRGRLGALPRNSVFMGIIGGHIARIVVSLNFAANIAAIEQNFGFAPALRRDAECAANMLTDHEACSAYYYGCISAASKCAIEVLTYMEPFAPARWGGSSGHTIIVWSAASKLPGGFP